MKAKNLGVLSILTASLCCLGPLLLIVLGLGGLGAGALLGKYHWYFIAGATALLSFAWRSYFKEKRACAANACKMVGKKMTRNVLALASTAVLVMAGLNIYTYAKSSPDQIASYSGTQVAIPVKGMTCFSCEFAVQSSVKKLAGVTSVQASAKDAKALVAYDPEQTSLKEIVEAINNTGYKATRPRT